MSNQTTFALAPSISFPRYPQDLSHKHKTSMNVGDLVPHLNVEVLPSDTFRFRDAFVARVTSSFIKVPLDNLFMDTNYFFVPYRILWDKWVNLMGENTEGFWTQSESPTVPTTRSAPSILNLTQTLTDYLGYNVDSGSVEQLNSQLPYRAFAKIWNDWYRNENTQAPVIFKGGTLDTMPQNVNNNRWAPNNIFGLPPKASKFHDYFTSCLPAPQKHSPVELTIGGDIQAPVDLGAVHSITPGINLGFSSVASGKPVTQSGTLGLTTGNAWMLDGSFVGSRPVAPNNLYADLSGINTGISVNDIRLAFALQRMYEADSVFGTRYTEILQGQYGCKNPDARLQRSEYLGGYRTPIEFQAVAQTSAGSEDSPQANLSSYSHTSGTGSFIKSFTEFGVILGISCIRQKHTYSQGVQRSLFRLDRLDFFNPVFQNIGDQPVYTKEIYGATADDVVFGYQSANASYRYLPDRVSGYLRPGNTSSLREWTFADFYTNAPVLNQEFLNETSAFVDRTLSVPSESTPNFIVDWDFNIQATRLVKSFVMPSLIDHNGRG